jgi:hypothetical protein
MCINFTEITIKGCLFYYAEKARSFWLSAEKKIKISKCTFVPGCDSPGH